jgi:uncharacterized protein (DUF1684 family)
MNDKELLELAAKAAEIKLCFIRDDMPRNCTGMHESMNIFSAPIWNPLTDDGDALRLAVKLFFEIDISNVAISIRSSNGLLFEKVDTDPYTATRRAIVRAAAEIGKTK